MNTFVAHPHWGGWIVGYFFLGGIASGAYAVASLVDLVGDACDRELVRPAYFLAFPLVAVCGVLLILDLDQPVRFWHMLIQSETGRPMFKPWSPMSIGAWALLLFGIMSGLSFVMELAHRGTIGLRRLAGVATRLHHGPIAIGYQLAGVATACFIASYTGTLLAATNQPVWSDSPWLSALFLAGGASTGTAAILLASAWRGNPPSGSLERLRRAEVYLILLEIAALAAFLASLGPFAWPVMRSRAGRLLLIASLAGGMAIPLALHFRPEFFGRRTAVLAGVFVLGGGLCMRAAVLAVVPEVLSWYS